MKKIVIAIAAFALAASVQAASMNWKYTSSTDNGKSVMSFNGSDYDTVVALLTEGGSSVSASVSALNLGGATMGKRAGSGSSQNVSAENKLFIVLFDSSIADGNTYSISSIQDVSAYTFAEGEAPKDTFGFETNMMTSNQKIGTGSVPEPTTGLLVLLGMAGLALKRKVA